MPQSRKCLMCACFPGHFPTIRFKYVKNRMSSQLLFFVNGQQVIVDNPRPEMTLLQYLRTELGLTGTKLGCAEGGCGACTVLISSFLPDTKRIKHAAVNACLTPICSVHLKHVVTVEGIGTSDRPHPVQERIGKMFGSQCGFCTPGIVMAFYAFLRNHPNPTDHEIEEAFDGNLCRCTGYRPILDAAKSFSSCGSCTAESCCKNSTENSGVADDSVLLKCGPNVITVKKYDPSQELIFPPVLQRLSLEPQSSLRFKSSHCEWIAPKSLEELLAIKFENPAAKIVNGNTEVGIETKFKQMHYPVMVYPMYISDLQKIRHHHNGIEFGACLTLTDFRHALVEAVKADDSGYKTRSFRALLENLRWFAGNQIRNVATIAGNIVTASPISDLNPVFVAANSVLNVMTRNSNGVAISRSINMTDFFLGYRKTALHPSEIVTSIFVPFNSEFEYVQAFKQAKRRDDDIAIVTAGLRVKLKSRDSAEMLVEDCCFAYGGMGPTTVTAKKIKELCIGRLWDRSLVDEVIHLMTQSDLLLPASAPGGMVEFRRSLATSFFFKFFLSVRNEISPSFVDDREKCALEGKYRPVSKAQQVFVDNTQNITVGKSETHLSALKQVTGEAIYTDDIPKQAGELYAGLVMSAKAHALIKSIDPSAALKAPGVRGFVSYKDVPGHNMIGPVFKDEEIFASEKVHFCGQIIALVLADSQMQAQAAAKLVRVEYEELKPILTIEDAIATNSFFPLTKTMSTGDIDKGFKESAHVVEGEIRIGGQEHFYLETNASLVIPKGEGEIEIWASTQNPTETQHLVAHALHLPSNRVVCKVKRMGGGFGGKETRSAPLTCALAVAAYRLKKPIRCMLDRDEDMILSGQRHPFLGKYKVGFTKDGTLTALDVRLFSNGGYSADLSIAVMERAVAHSDNCYKIPNVHVHGKVCKTNIHSNTAYRGFGGPQGMVVAETWINHVADFLGVQPEVIREKNMYKPNEKTHFNQELDNFYIPRLWHELKKSSEWDSRRAAVNTFNANNQWKKRGLAIIPTKFGIAFTARFLNQAGALVHVYTDGSVLLSHGGTEMGQGLHTKCAQICADALGIPLSQVHISETATDKVANTSPTAASASSDLNGMATLVACQQIADRLAPYRLKNPDASFADIVLTAYRDRVNLSANGYYRTPDLTYDWDKNEGRLFNYFTFGVAASEVEVDLLTGDFQMLRTDVIMDLGKSLNPCIDIGQIEGAFVQGAGWSTIEETVFFPNGQLFTRGPGNYKIPGFTDIPIDFRVSLLSEAENPRAVHSSKAVGEPPFFLGTSVYLAIRDAIKAARDNAYIRLDLPATADRIRTALDDPMIQMARSVPRRADERDWCLRV